MLRLLPSSSTLVDMTPATRPPPGLAGVHARGHGCQLEEAFTLLLQQSTARRLEPGKGGRSRHP
jgi:hypothetical protein